MTEELITNRKGRVRTDMSCTECGKNFIVQMDFDLDGNHVVECPWCAHEHCRVIKAGTVTSDRWDSRAQRVEVPPRDVWKVYRDGPMATSAAAAFIRDAWLNRESEQ